MGDFLSGIAPGALATLQALLVSALAVVAVFLGFSLLVNLPKLRRSGGHSRVVRGLEEVVGGRQTYLAPDAPRGTVDQLRTPELLEAKGRKSA